MVTNAPRFSINIMADKIYFRVNPLYTKHVLKSVEHYFSHITVWKKITLYKISLETIFTPKKIYTLENLSSTVGLKLIFS